MPLFHGSRARSHGAATLFIAILLPAVPRPAVGQAVGPVAGATLLSPGPADERAWSALAPLTDLTRALPIADAALPALLIAPAPRIGLLWTAGNPAALPLEVTDSWTTFNAERSSADGDYRRPLDPGTDRRTQFAGAGWRRVGSRGAAIGRAGYQSSEFGDAVYANVHSPFGANPHVIVDTSGTALDRSAAVLEGALGWQLWGVSAGVALSYEAADTRTLASPVPRTFVRSTPGVRIGIATRLGSSTRIGAHGRWQGGAETVRIWAVGAGTQLFHLEGYNEPRTQNLSTFYFRRLERDGTAGGLAAAGTLLNTRWTAFVEAGSATEGHYSEVSTTPVMDRWSAESITAGIALQRSSLSDRLLGTLDVRWTTLDGEAERSQDETIAFVARESSILASAEVRWTAARWQAAGLLHVLHTDRQRRDLSVGARSEIDALQTSIGLAVSRALVDRLHVAVAAAGAVYDPVGGIPDPSGLGPIYERFIAPELSLHATPARARVASLTANWHATTTTHVWARLLSSHVAPATAGTILPRSPTGERSGWSLSVGINLLD